MCVLDGWERACIGTNGWLKDPPSRTRLTNCPPLPVKHVIPHSTSLSQFVDLVAFEIMFGCICSSYQLCVASKLLVLLPSDLTPLSEVIIKRHMLVKVVCVL